MINRMAQAAAKIPVAAQVMADAMQLPEPERAELVLELLRSLSPLDAEEPPTHADPDTALTAELRRRRQAYLDGESGWVSLEALEAELDAL